MSDDGNGPSTPMEASVRRASSSGLEFGRTTAILVARLKQRNTIASLALVEEGERLVSVFDAWKISQPEIAVRNGVYAEALRWHDSARLVLGDREPIR